MDTSAITTRIRLLAASRLLKAAITLQSESRRDVSRGNPSPHDHPAPRGEYPRLRTGQGRANIGVEPTNPAVIAAKGSVSVGHRPGGNHLFFLSEQGWLGVRNTLARHRSAITTILRGA